MVKNFKVSEILSQNQNKVYMQIDVVNSCFEDEYSKVKESDDLARSDTEKRE